MEWAELISLGWRVLAVILLVALNGFFVAAEFALVKVRDTQLRPLIDAGNRRAKLAARIHKQLDSFLSAAQLGITLASLGLGWIGEPVFSALLAPVFAWMGIESAEIRHYLGFAIGFSVITFLHISAGEQAPKWFAIQKPLPTTLWVTYPMLWFYRLSYPLVVVLNRFSQWLLAQVGMKPASEHEDGHTEEELRLLLAAGQNAQGGSLARDLVLNALDLRRRSTGEAMRPRQEIVPLDTTATIAECLDVAEKTRYSRFPLCEGGDLDKTLGVVHIKDLYAMRLKARCGADLLPVLRKLIYVPETSRLEKLLQIFLDRKSHFAIVVDEYGGTVGIITMENILEELVGQIQDEFDQEKPLLVKTGEHAWDVSGAWPLHELAELTGQPLKAEGVTTSSGFITQKLGGFPKVGDVLSLGPFVLRVLETDGMRVGQFRITRRSNPE